MSDYTKEIHIGSLEMSFEKIILPQKNNKNWLWHLVRINKKGMWCPNGWSGDWKLGINGDYRITRSTSWFAWIYAFIDALVDMSNKKNKLEPVPSEAK